MRGELRRQRREQEACVQSQLQESSADPAWEQLAPLLDEAIGQLGKADRNAVVLRFFQNAFCWGVDNVTCWRCVR
jgi:DNA-directed RNA polymerase specialized sigma24 family protein